MPADNAIQYETRLFVAGDKPADVQASERVIYNPIVPGDPDGADKIFLDELNKMGAEGWEAFHVRYHSSGKQLTVIFRRRDPDWGCY